MGYTAIDRDDEDISTGGNEEERGMISLSWKRRQGKN